MKLDFSAARAGQAGCPSERTLDALHLGALPEDERAAAAAHVAGCGDCAARLAEIQQGFQAFADLDERAVLARIQTRHAEAKARRRERPLYWRNGA